MKKIVLAAACVLAAPLAFAGPFESFKGKMKPGLYDTKVEMDMGAIPGLPPGMGKQTMSHQHCVTEKDIEDGGFGKDNSKRDQGDCEIKDVKMSGNTATYKMVCPKGNMNADAKVSFNGSGYTMDMVMNMEQGGRPMTMKHHSEGKYLGPCK